MDGKIRKSELELLNEAFNIFNTATEKLQESYQKLKEETEKLRKEVEEKNQKLEETSSLLSSVLMSTNNAIVAIADDNSIILSNKKYKEYYEIYGDQFLSKLIEFKAEGSYEFDLKGAIFRVHIGKFEHSDVKGWTYSVEDITHLKELEEEHRRDEHLKSMGVMAANIAHEIRNPLGSIELFASLLARDLKNDNEKRVLIESVLKGVKSINSTISNILLFTKEVIVNKKEYYLSDIVDDVVLYLRHLMNDKKIKFVNKIDENFTIYCDNELMKQVFMNLIHNSIDAVNTGGIISVSCYQEGDFDIIIVEDNGCGINEDFMKKIFIPFHTSKTKGTGLGLSIVYKIIKAHSGNIYVESDGKSYTKFIIKLKRG
ncbi:ATP-binding protein [Deferribacter thermophilus]|uniref:sensor histidine kinase n=1 Tax=Deferribacter thermophilus TaxID=53573 RepID=UPI003C234ED0